MEMISNKKIFFFKSLIINNLILNKNFGTVIGYLIIEIRILKANIL